MLEMLEGLEDYSSGAGGLVLVPASRASLLQCKGSARTSVLALGASWERREELVETCQGRESLSLGLASWGWSWLHDMR